VRGCLEKPGQDLVDDAGARCRPASCEIPHHRRIAVQVYEVIGIVWREASQKQAFGVQPDCHPGTFLAITSPYES
jgi:hypothetical protein